MKIERDLLMKYYKDRATDLTPTGQRFDSSILLFFLTFSKNLFISTIRHKNEYYRTINITKIITIINH